MSETGGDGRGSEDDGGQEDFTSTTEVLVQRVDNKCSTDCQLEARTTKSRNSHATGGKENDGVDRTDDPLVSALSVDPELFGEGQVGTV